MGTWTEIIATFGAPVALLIYAFFAGSRGDWVFGREFRDLKAENKQLRALALRLGASVEQLIKASSVEPSTRADDETRTTQSSNILDDGDE